MLLEDSSGAALVEILLPAVIGSRGVPHTWRVVPYRGIGKFPPG